MDTVERLANQAKSCEEYQSRATTSGSEWGEAVLAVLALLAFFGLFIGPILVFINH